MTKNADISLFLAFSVMIRENFLNTENTESTEIFLLTTKYSKLHKKIY